MVLRMHDFPYDAGGLRSWHMVCRKEQIAGDSHYSTIDGSRIH